MGGDGFGAVCLDEEIPLIVCFLNNNRQFHHFYKWAISERGRKGRLRVVGDVCCVYGVFVCFIINKMKRVLYDMLSMGPYYFTQYQSSQYQIDPKTTPADLIHQLRNPKQAANLVNIMNTP